jgi:hypothetical protein
MTPATFLSAPTPETCTLYRSVNAAKELELPALSPGQQISFWIRNHRGLMALGGLLLLSLLLVLLR